MTTIADLDTALNNADTLPKLIAALQAYQAEAERRALPELAVDTCWDDGQFTFVLLETLI